MYLAQQQHQQQQAAMAAFMQHHGCGAGGFGPQGFGGQGFGFGAPGMVHMVPHYQQAMFSQPSVNASMQSAGTVQQPRHTQHTTTAVGDGQAMGNAGTDTAQRQPSQQLPQSQHLQPSPTLQLQQQQQQLLQAQQQQCNGGFASGNLPSGMGSNAGSWLGNGSVHGSNRGSRHGSSPDAEGDGSGEGNGSGDGSGDGSDTGAQPAVARQQSHKQDAAPVAPQPEPQQPPPEGHGDPAKAHTPFADVPQQNSGAFGGGRLYRPTASHARPSHSLSSLPLFAPDDTAAAAADADGNGTGNDMPADPQSPPAMAAAAPHNAPHSAFMRPHTAVKAEAHNENGGGSGNGSGSGNSTADGGRSRGSGEPHFLPGHMLGVVGATPCRSTPKGLCAEKIIFCERAASLTSWSCPALCRRRKQQRQRQPGQELAAQLRRALGPRRCRRYGRQHGGGHRRRRLCLQRRQRAAAGRHRRRQQPP